jgi:hypothetical protein
MMFSARSCSPKVIQILVPGEPVAVAVGHGAGGDEAEVGAALGLGEAHGARPLAGDELGQVGLLLLLVDAAGEARAHPRGLISMRPGPLP